jgi:hypothetical protein
MSRRHAVKAGVGSASARFQLVLLITIPLFAGRTRAATASGGTSPDAALAGVAAPLR